MLNYLMKQNAPNNPIHTHTHTQDTEIRSNDGRKEGNKRTQTLRRGRKLFERRSTSLQTNEICVRLQSACTCQSESGVCVLYLQ